MTKALTGLQRTILERLVGRARKLLETDLAAQAAGGYGIDTDGTVADEASLRLDQGQLAARRELVDVLEHLRSEGCGPLDSVARLIREAVFTHLNRLIAIRIAEALDLLPASLASGRSSQGYRDFLELAPLLAGDGTDGYWSYLQLCGDELAGDVPALFDPRNPLLNLAPSPTALADLTELLAEPANADLWVLPDCLGWVYQFFNTGEERRAMREGSSAPRDSRELAVRNQFFTPRYVVDFLVQNSLGRRLMDAEPGSPLLDDLPLLVEPPAEPGEPIKLADVAVLDPACGSGHFLLTAYDILERAWHHAGVDSATAAPDIIGSLWGIDIDPRCTQVAAAALMFRARSSCPIGKLPRPNIICARALPATTSGLEEVLAVLPTAQRRLLQSFTEALADAPVLGPLLKVEVHLASNVRSAAFGGHAPPGSLADALPDSELRTLKDDVLDTLHRIADATTATPAERLLAAEAEDALRFVHALQRRYDAVFMNPPFGEPVSNTKTYLRMAYPGAPHNCDLFSVFVERGLQLCAAGGYLGALTSRAGMFLRSFERWRSEVLLGHQLVALADLGFGVMEHAMVEAAAYILRAEKAIDDTATFIRLLREVDRPRALASAVSSARNGSRDDHIFRVALRDFYAIPGAPIAYWMNTNIRKLFVEEPQLEGEGAHVRAGLCTGDDFRFVRCIWEISPQSITPAACESDGAGWLPFAKGGQYSPYWADIHLVVDWRRNGIAIQNARTPGTRIQNRAFYCLTGLTWTLRTASGFGPRILPGGCIFGHKGPAVITDIASAELLLGVLNSRLASVLIGAMIAAGDETTSGTASKSYEVGVIQRLPVLLASETSDAVLRIRERVKRIGSIRASFDTADETARRFVRPAVRGSLAEGAKERVRLADEAHIELLKASYELECEVHRALNLDRDAERFLDEEAGPHPYDYPGSGLTDDSWFRDLYLSAMDHAIDEIVELKGGSPSSFPTLAPRPPHGLTVPPKLPDLGQEPSTARSSVAVSNRRRRRRC